MQSELMLEKPSAPAEHQIRLAKPLLSRLMGMETEYATLVADPQDLEADDLPPSRLVYEQLYAAIRRDQPCVAGIYDGDQMFLANGAAVSFESHPLLHDLPGGLIELATPEVTSPTDLLTCQRSIDELVADAAAESETSFDLRVLKNSSDAMGHIYGCQENYEADVATGAMLWVYRACILFLWAVQVITFLVSLPVLGIVMASVALARLRGRGKEPPPETSQFQFDWENDGDEIEPSSNEDGELGNARTNPFGTHNLFTSMPRWGSLLVIQMLRIIHFPTVLMLGFVARYVAFRSQRKYLTALLASRIVLCGTGHFDLDGKFQLSSKALAIDSVTHMGGFRGERPIYVFGHWLSQFCAKSFFSLGSTRAMLAKRQRLQIGLSDSNLCDLAEYVKCGSVSLVLDMIEQRHTDELPVLKDTVNSLHRITNDWDLITRVPTNRGPMSALDIQKRYLKAAKKFVQRVPNNMAGESKLLLYRWQELFEAAEAFRRDAQDIRAGLGRVDWMSKRFLIDRLGTDASWQEKKKVDLRYHELSADGYFTKLIKTRPDLRLIDEDQIERRRRSPPSGTPAAYRGWLIREFAGEIDLLQSEWRYALLQQGRKRRRIDFSKPNQVQHAMNK